MVFKSLEYLVEVVFTDIGQTMQNPTQSLEIVQSVHLLAIYLDKH